MAFWVKLGFINFGGPAGQIAIMHRELVEKKRWISERSFLRGLNYCTILPGPEAQQLATYIGWRLHGTLGGVIAGSFFIIPAIFLMLILSWLTVVHADLTLVAGALYGVQPIVIAIVAEAVLRIGRRALRPRSLVALAVAAFVSIYFLSVPFPIVIAVAAVVGLLLQRYFPKAIELPPGARSGHGTSEAEPSLSVPKPSIGKVGLLLATFLALWAIPIGLLVLWQGTDGVLFELATFFTWTAFVTFGGAYAVLSLVADQAVNHFGWLTSQQMVFGLGLAESTPGPFIMVLQYVGFVGAYGQASGVNPTLNGTMGALITTYVTFLPSFLFILLGAPYVELMAGNRRISAAMTAVTAAVVGVIANLGIFFATKVIFRDEEAFDIFAAVTALVAFVALVRFKLPTYILIIVGVLLGIAKVAIERA